MEKLGLAAIVAACAMAQQTQPVTSFEDDGQMALLAVRDTRYEAVTDGVTDGARALRITFGKVQWPALFFRPAAAWDLRQWGEIALDVTNPEDEQVSFSVRVDDDMRANGTLYCRTGTGTLAPGERRTFSFPLSVRNAMDSGMKGLPTWAGAKSLGSNGSWTLELSHIVQFQIFMSSPQRERTLIVDNVRFREAPPLDGIVDEFGQYTGADWPGKLHSQDEFAQRFDAEVEDLTAQREAPGRDVYGGWSSGPRLEAGNFFRVQKVDGKWWLVTPDGTLFFSSGVDGVRPGAATFVTSREQMFTWLPGQEDPLAKYFGKATSSQGPVRDGVTYDFHLANLERKYGADWKPAWRWITMVRLWSWGFNTIANWSDASMALGGMPYVTTTHYGGNFAWIALGSSGMGDPFDARWEAAVRAVAAQTIAPVAWDPWVLGHFVDNELPWSSNVAATVLGLKAENSPAKAAFTAALREKYGEIGALNQAWGTAFESWTALGAPKTPYPAAAQKDLSDLLRMFARRYYSKVREVVKEADPNHLYLGSRINVYVNEVVEAAAEFCDVVSFNVYRRSIDPAQWTHLEGLDKPAIIGEFHFGALDRGMFHTGLQAAAGQEQRAAYFQGYLESVLRHPSFVGAHWFLLYDQPLTGRTQDGENYNIGFLTVTDTPYPEMVRAARAVHASMYELRAGQ